MMSDFTKFRKKAEEEAREKKEEELYQALAEAMLVRIVKNTANLRLGAQIYHWKNCSQN